MSSKNADDADRSPPRRPWSITARLAAGYAALTTLVLAGAVGFLYWTLRGNLRRSEERFLADKIQVLQTVTQGRMVSSRLREEVQLEIAAYQFTRYFARVLNGPSTAGTPIKNADEEGGSVLIETDRMATLLPPRVFPEPTGTAPTQSERWTAPSGRRYLLMTARAPNGRVLQVALDVSAQAKLLADYRRALLAVLVAAVLCSAGGGVVVARRGMRPLQAIAKTAEHISAAQLDKRIRPIGWPAELQTLARAFDAMLDRLETSFERLRRFSADLAHELRTPVSNLMGETEVTLSKSRTKDEYRRVLESSLEEYRRLARMIKDLLFLARAERTEVPLDRQPLNARDTLESMQALFGGVAAERKIDLRHQGTATVYADPGLLRRALSNLISNAIEHTPPGGAIRLVGHSLPNGAAEIVVEDTGEGIAREHLPHLFDRFYQADPARSGPTEGTGLGLSIVQSIVDLHDGTITVDSEPERGTVVTLRFPTPDSKSTTSAP